MPFNLFLENFQGLIWTLSIYDQSQKKKIQKIEFSDAYFLGWSQITTKYNL